MKMKLTWDFGDFILFSVAKKPWLPSTLNEKLSEIYRIFFIKKREKITPKPSISINSRTHTHTDHIEIQINTNAVASIRKKETNKYKVKRENSDQN